MVLPFFALANTAIVIGTGALSSLTEANSVGIMSGLLAGKPVGITLLSLIAVSAGLCRLPADLNWKPIIGAGILGGIGFTMSIFITNLAFVGETPLIDASKLAILLASLTAGVVGFLWLRVLGKPVAGDDDMHTLDFVVTP